MILGYKSLQSTGLLSWQIIRIIQWTLGFIANKEKSVLVNPAILDFFQGTTPERTHQIPALIIAIVQDVNEADFKMGVRYNFQ